MDACSITGRVIPHPLDDPRENCSRGERTAVLAGGCFWGTQAVFERLAGVNRVAAGYAGGSADTADYEAASSGKTGHAESVKIWYDPAKISYGTLLRIFFSIAHDPTELNRQGPDSGTQYRSAIFYADEGEEKIAKSYVAQLTAQKIFQKPIATQIVPLENFYQAEDYHQDYAKNNPDNPYIALHDAPKVRELEKHYPNLCAK